MNYKKDPGIMFNLDLANLSEARGNLSSLNKGNFSEYITSLILILPLNQENYKEGTFQVEYQGNLININIYKIQDKSKDPISSLAKNVFFGLNENKMTMLPFEAISDNKGKYPCFYAEIIFPFRLADWIEPNHKYGVIDYDPEEVAVTGPIQNKDKITALIVLNKLFSNVEYKPKIKRLFYDDVTVFLENYHEKKNANIIFQKLNYFTSPEAYKNSITEYFLGYKTSEIPIKQSTIEINNEEDLLQEILSAINEIKHHIENRYKIQPFWDSSRTISQNGKNIDVPPNPKNETNIQPTLQLLLEILLSGLGVHVVRETDEGVGFLDFRCLYTTKKNNAISISIEFKLAHHKKIKHGLTKQFPACLRANHSNSGVFIVMWFRDEKGRFFKEPKDRKKSEMIKFLEETSKTIEQKEGVKINTILIDASFKPSASKL